MDNNILLFAICIYQKNSNVDFKSSLLQKQSSGSVLHKNLFGKFSQKFTEKYLCACLFLNKVTDCSPSSLLEKLPPTMFRLILGKCFKEQPFLRTLVNDFFCSYRYMKTLEFITTKKLS